jgi:hypothetical protein
VSVVLAILGLVAVFGGVGVVAARTLRDNFPQKVQPFGVSMSGCPYPASAVAETLEMFLTEWAKLHGHKEADKFYPLLRKMTIEWVPAAFRTTVGVADGLTTSPTQIKLSSAFAQLRLTGLVHELVHVGLMLRYGNGDHDHEGPAVKVWTTDHTMLIMRVMRAKRVVDDTKIA